MDKKGEEITMLDVSQRCAFADYFIVATGYSAKQLQAIADHLKATDTSQLLQTEGYQSAEWIVLDFGAVIVHLFQPKVRQHYKLDQLWSEGGFDQAVEYLQGEMESPLEKKIRELRSATATAKGHLRA